MHEALACWRAGTRACKHACVDVQPKDDILETLQCEPQGSTGPAFVPLLGHADCYCPFLAQLSLFELSLRPILHLFIHWYAFLAASSSQLRAIALSTVPHRPFTFAFMHMRAPLAALAHRLLPHPGGSLRVVGVGACSGTAAGRLAAGMLLCALCGRDSPTWALYSLRIYRNVRPCDE